MKLSTYNTLVNIDDKNILYNTLSRKYIIYDNLKKEHIDNLLNNLYEKTYTFEDGEILKKLIRNEMIVEDDLDELLKIKFNENKARFQDETFYLVIQTTLDCNFRCSYCYQEHKNINFNNQSKENLIKFVTNISKKIRKLTVAWFGGEPMMKFEMIKELTKEFKNICKKNGCAYEAKMTTNGYLFCNENISLLQELSIKQLQITLDGTKEYHDKKRPLYTGEGTFEKIMNNVTTLLDTEVNITLRINVDEGNISNIENLFDMIPKDKRKKVIITICNLFQNNGKINLFDLYKCTISKGFIYYNTKNGSLKCEAALKNSCTIQPDGRISSCSISAEDGFYWGKINEAGNIIINDKSNYLKFQDITALDNEKCKQCIQLPMCMGGCKYSRYKNDDICNMQGTDGLSLEEKIKLHYYSDLKNNNIEGNFII